MAFGPSLKFSSLEKKSQEVLENFGDQIYFFILRKVKDKDTANGIFQNSFLKIHNNLHQVKDPEKIKSWIFQVSRNEIANYYNQNSSYVNAPSIDRPDDTKPDQKFCCFDRFIDELPETYKEAIELVYINGIKQYEAAELLGISLANVKARIRRGKSILKENFKECCKFKLNRQDNLIGEPDCDYCDH